MRRIITLPTKEWSRLRYKRGGPTIIDEHGTYHYGTQADKVLDELLEQHDGRVLPAISWGGHLVVAYDLVKPPQQIEPRP